MPGLTQEVIEFDKARVKHKKYPRDVNFLQSHDRMLAIIHTQISRQKRLLKDELNKWERGFTQQIAKCHRRKTWPKTLLLNKHLND